MKWVSRFRLLRAWWLCIFTFIQQELKVHDILFLFYFNGFNRFILSFYCSLYLYRGCQECANLWGRNEWFCSCWFSSMSLALDTDIGHKPISKYSVRLGSNVRTAGRCHKFGHGCTLTTSSRLTNSYLFARQPVYQVQETNQSRLYQPPNLMNLINNGFYVQESILYSLIFYWSKFAMSYVLQYLYYVCNLNVVVMWNPWEWL